MMFSIHKAERGTTNGITGLPLLFGFAEHSFLFLFLSVSFFALFALWFLRVLFFFLWLFLGG